MIIDEAGENLGVMPREAAFKLAQDKELDLIEIAPQANPPVAKIISYDKFRYQKEKEMKKQRASQKASELKEIRITPRSAKNDLETRIKKIEEFFKDGHKVGITLVLKGREKYNREWATIKLKEFLQMLPFEYRTVMEPKFGGRGLMMQIQGVPPKKA